MRCYWHDVINSCFFPTSTDIKMESIEWYTKGDQLSIFRVTHFIIFLPRYRRLHSYSQWTHRSRSIVESNDTFGEVYDTSGPIVPFPSTYNSNDDDWNEKIIRLEWGLTVKSNCFERFVFPSGRTWKQNAPGSLWKSHTNLKFWKSISLDMNNPK